MARVAAKDLREVAKRTPDETGARVLRRYRYAPELQGGSVTMDPTGRRIVAVDRAAGTLVVLDAASLRVSTTIRLCEGPEQVAVSRTGRAFVTCRGSGEVVAIDPTSTDKATRVSIGADPFGIALAPDGATVYVTSAADGRVRALSARTLRTRWTVAVSPHPRGVAVSPDGGSLVVAHLVGLGATVVDTTTRVVRSASLPAKRDGWPSELFEFTDLADSPRRVPGGAFAVAMSPGGTRAFVPYLLRNDGSGIDEFTPGCYANGASIPIAPSVAAVDVSGARVLRPRPRDLPERAMVDVADTSVLTTLANLGVVRAAVHDPRRSRLFVLGEGSGEVVAFDTSSADPTAAPLGDWFVGGPADGIAVDRDGRRLFVHLDDGRLAVLDPSVPEAANRFVELGAPAVDAGRRLFYTANDRRVSVLPGVACSTCHLDGRADGVTWRLDGTPLQTPILAGRASLGGPLRWHGDSPDLGHAIREAIHRIGGDGVDDDGVAALARYLRALPEPRASSRPAERGAEVFESAGCASCHAPESGFADGLVHDVRGGRFRTPSLRGVALSAPYYHDGSAATLEALLAAHERGNPMAVGARLSAADRRALGAFLRTL